MSCPKTSIFSVFQKLMLSSIPCWNEAEQQSMEKNKDWLDVENFHFSPPSVKVSVIEQQRVTNCWYSSFFHSKLLALGKLPWTRTMVWCTGDCCMIYCQCINHSCSVFRHVIDIIPLWNLRIRSFIYLFDQLEKRKDDATFVIKASYLEIYNEKVNLPVFRF